VEIKIKDFAKLVYMLGSFYILELLGAVSKIPESGLIGNASFSGIMFVCGPICFLIVVSLLDQIFKRWTHRFTNSGSLIYSQNLVPQIFTYFVIVFLGIMVTVFTMNYAQFFLVILWLPVIKWAALSAVLMVAGRLALQDYNPHRGITNGSWY